MIPYLPDGVYADLRTASNIRFQLQSELTRIQNWIIRWFNIYFPEYKSVYGKVDSISGMMILKVAPLLEDIVTLGVDGINKICIVQSLSEYGDMIQDRTGLKLSPYFPAAKMAWLLQNTDMGKEPLSEVCLGTIDSWLIFRMTNGESFKTNYSSASRTQLFSIRELRWNEELCRLFGVPLPCLAEVCDSNSVFGMTDLGGIFPRKIPIHSAIGDSHAALYGQGCHHSGEIKTTYGTGSSIMMNVGEAYVKSSHGLVTSLAWRIDGKVDYVRRAILIIRER